MNYYIGDLHFGHKNILKYDESPFGTIEERDKYRANEIKPGLTGLAQINGRDELEIPVKAKLDGEYVEKMSLLFDIKIFFKTIFKVFRHDGIVEGKNLIVTYDDENGGLDSAYIDKLIKDTFDL